MALSRNTACLACAIAHVGCASARLAQLCPPDLVATGKARVVLETIADSRLGDPVDNPLALVESGDGRLFMVNRPGTVHVIEGGVINPIPTLDIRGELLWSHSRGLTGFALHRDFHVHDAPGYSKIYVYYTQEAGTAPATWPLQVVEHQNVLAEWTMDPLDPGRVHPDSRREIFRADHRSIVHMGGDLKWGPDSYLYIAIGSPPSRRASSQENDHPDGSIMRIDPLDPSLTPLSPDPVSTNGRYRVPIDNPFVGMAIATPEVWAFGLRHPWRMSFDRVTGELFSADVGGSLHEEINHIQRGANYGWPYREGPCEGPDAPPMPPPHMHEPIVAYGHADGTAIIGGHVYRGAAMPWLRGTYIFADHSREGFPTAGRLLAVDLYDEFGTVREPSRSGIVEVRPAVIQNQLDFTVHSLSEDACGELYVMGLGRDATTIYSVIRRIIPACWADCDQSTGAGVLDVFDFLCFGNLFAAGDPYACDCDASTGRGVCDVFDYLCFGNAFSQGCEL